MREKRRNFIKSKKGKRTQRYALRAADKKGKTPKKTCGKAPKRRRRPEIYRLGTVLDHGVALPQQRQPFEEQVRVVAHRAAAARQDVGGQPAGGYHGQ